MRGAATAPRVPLVRDDVVSAPSHATRHDRLLLGRSVGCSFYAAVSGSPRSDIRYIVAAKTDGDAEQRAQNGADGRTTRCLGGSRALIGQLLTLGDIVLIVAAAHAGIH